MNTISTPPPASAEPTVVTQPWWKYPIVWLMLGGPAVVVVASVVTTVIAMHGADPVIRPAVSSADTGSKSALMPAASARNHVATPAR